MPLNFGLIRYEPKLSGTENRLLCNNKTNKQIKPKHVGVALGTGSGPKLKGP